MMKKGLLFIFLACSMLNANAVESDSLFSDKKPGKKTQVFKTKTSGSFLSLLVDAANHGGTVTITGPQGFSISQEFDGQSLSVNLLEKAQKLPAGRYHYQITAHIGERRLIVDTIDNGRGEDNFTYAGTPVSYSGSFVVKAGSVVNFAQLKEGSSSEW